MLNEEWPKMPGSLQDKVSLEDILARIKKEVLQISERLRRSYFPVDLPIDKELRIDMKSCIPKGSSQEDFLRDDKRVREAESKQLEEAIRRIERDPVRKQLAGNRIVELAEREIKIGKIWEMLATAILDEKLGQDFIVTRTSRYDDICNGDAKVDTLLLDKKTGKIICVFDEVVTLDDREKDERFKEKKKNIAQLNNFSGAKLKYGISFEGSDDNRKLKRRKVENIPTFYLDITMSQLDELMANPGTRENIFREIMIKSLKGQIDQMENDFPKRTEIEQRIRQKRRRNSYDKDNFWPNRLLFRESFDYFKTRFSEIFE